MKRTSITEVITRGRFHAEKAAPHLLAITLEELDRYRAEHIGRQGWGKRKAEGYAPSKVAQYMKDYRARNKAQQQQVINE